MADRHAADRGHRRSSDAAALEKLRRFCLGSTVWRTIYEDGYLGALPEHGFACPLLAQIAEELRPAFPAIFAGHPLRYFWAFKYDSNVRASRCMPTSPR